MIVDYGDGVAVGRPSAPREVVARPDDACTPRIHGDTRPDSCQYLRQLPLKLLSAMLAGNVCEQVTAKRGETSKPGLSPRRVSLICYTFPPSANRSSHGPCRVRSSFRSGKTIGLGSLIG